MSDTNEPIGSPHPQVQAYLDRLAAANVGELHTFTPDQARTGWRRQIPLLAEPEPVAEVENRQIATAAGPVSVRIYTPEGTGPFPALVFFHGGGFVMGDLDTHDGLCRSLAAGARTVVVAVEYPLAPENKFPAAPDTCLAATVWVAEHAKNINADPSRIAVGGDSAGGNLAAVVTHRARDRDDLSLAFQLLIYPDVDFRRENHSIRTLAGKHGNVSRAGQNWFMDNYLNTEEEKQNPSVSPLLAPDLTGVPPALIITAEFDALRDEGEEYGRRLEQAGVPVVVSRYPGMIHEFIRHRFDASAQARHEAAAALSAAFASVAS